MKVINNFKRENLTEGRNFGIGFAFMEKNKENWKSLQAFTACKDYLNDVVFSERSGDKLDSIYGFQHTPIGFLRGEDYFYLGVTTLDYNKGKDWNKKTNATKILIDNRENLVKALQKLEEKIKVKNRTTISAFDENHLILKCPIIWTRQSFMISLLTLFVRSFFNVSKETVELGVSKMVKAQQDKTFIPADKYLYNGIIEYITYNHTKANKLIYPPTTSKVSTVHNGGIVTLTKAVKNSKTLKEAVS